MPTIPDRSRGELTEAEERELRDGMPHDPSHDEVYGGSPNPTIVFRVELSHAQMAALSAVRARDSTRPNLADLIQCWVDERLTRESGVRSTDRSA